MYRSQYLSIEECLQLINKDLDIENLYDSEYQFKSIQNNALATKIVTEFSSEDYEESCPETLELVKLDNNRYKSTLLNYHSKRISKNDLLYQVCFRWRAHLEMRYDIYEKIYKIIEEMNDKKLLENLITDDVITFEYRSNHKDFEDLMSDTLKFELNLYQLKLASNFDYNAPSIYIPLLPCIELLETETKSILIKILSEESNTEILSKGINQWRYKVIQINDFIQWLSKNNIAIPKSLKMLSGSNNERSDQSNLRQPKTEKLGIFIRQLIKMIDPSIKPDSKGSAILSALNKKLPGDEVLSISDKTLTKYLDL